MCYWFHACVCSGHIPHHKCCCVDVISRVQIAFHITSHIPLHHTKRFYISPPSTSDHSTSHHHCTTFHITLLHTNVPRHISQTVNVATHLTSDHNTLQSVSAPPFHTTTSQSTCSTSHSHTPHLTPFHIHHCSTPHPHSASQHI